MPAREIPVIVGVGDIKNRSTKVEDAREPAQLMLDAIQSALEDTGLQDTACLREHIDSIDVVRTWTCKSGRAICCTHTLLPSDISCFPTLFS